MDTKVRYKNNASVCLTYNFAFSLKTVIKTRLYMIKTNFKHNIINTFGCDACGMT